MAYPESCFENLIGVHGLCEPKEGVLWLDDVPGVDLNRLAAVVDGDAKTGEGLARKLIESAARMMAADVEAIYDAQYKVQNSLVSGCSSCSFTSNYSAGNQRGIMIKDNTTSTLSKLSIDKLTVRVNSSGTFHVVIDDGNSTNQRVIEHTFVAGDQVEFTGINYTTRSKVVRIYFQENTVLMAQLSCPRSSTGCGCSGTSARIEDLVYTGLVDGAESQQAYGFQPCAGIRCDAADLLCYVANSAPRMIGMALLFKTTELYFETQRHSVRNNKIAGARVDDTKDDVSKYTKLYQNKLNGVGTRGVKDVVFTTLQQTTDACIVCNSLLGTSWATG